MKLAGLWLSIVLIDALCSCSWISTVATAKEEEIVSDIYGRTLRYGSNYTFDIRVYNETTTFGYGFFFGLGDPVDQVKTNTDVSLGVSGPPSLVVCQNGTGVSGFQGSTPPEAGLFIVRHNRTFGFYTLQLADSPMAIQFNTSAKPFFSCTPNASSTPIQFIYNLTASTPSSSSSSSHSLSPFPPLFYSLVFLCAILGFSLPF